MNNIFWKQYGKLKFFKIKKKFCETLSDNDLYYLSVSQNYLLYIIQTKLNRNQF